MGCCRKDSLTRLVTLLSEPTQDGVSIATMTCPFFLSIFPKLRAYLLPRHSTYLRRIQNARTVTLWTPRICYLESSPSTSAKYLALSPPWR